MSYAKTLLPALVKAIPFEDLFALGSFLSRHKAPFPLIQTVRRGISTNVSGIYVGASL